jgi:hypothetical protein
MRERIGPQLEVHDERARIGSRRRARRARRIGVDRLYVIGRAIAGGDPKAPALPAGLLIVDAAVDALRVEAERIIPTL